MGRIPLTLLACWDPVASVWTTSPVESLWEMELPSLTVPAWGGLRNRRVYRRTEPGLAAVKAEVSLPTPVADHSRGLPQPGTDFSSLPNAVIGLLPTPTAHPENTASVEWGYPTLLDAAKQVTHPEDEALELLPTPTARDGKGQDLPSRQGKPSLGGLAPLLPTPSVADAEGGHATRSGTRSDELLLPGLVRTFTPTNPGEEEPQVDPPGSQPVDGQLPGQTALEDFLP